jgi:hypothetical protein
MFSARRGPQRGPAQNAFIDGDLPLPGWAVHTERAVPHPWRSRTGCTPKTCAAGKAFVRSYDAKFPKAAAKIADDEDVLPTFCDYLAEHRIHLRTTNPIESTFATVRLRTRVRWRAVNAPHLVALVRAGARFGRGVLVERAEGQVA